MISVQNEENKETHYIEMVRMKCEDNYYRYGEQLKEDNGGLLVSDPRDGSVMRKYFSCMARDDKKSALIFCMITKIVQVD